MGFCELSIALSRIIMSYHSLEKKNPPQESGISFLLQKRVVSFRDTSKFILGYFRTQLSLTFLVHLTEKNDEVLS